MTRIITLIGILLTIMSPLRAETGYADLSAKASRFFQQQEWASASAMYQLMIDRNPDVADVYAHAIVADGMRNDTTQQQQLLRQAIERHLPFDSIFGKVRELSFSLGKATVYENFMIESRATLPWATRNINARLLDYYMSRGNAPLAIDFARKMLEGMPDNQTFLVTLAKAYMMAGEFDKAKAELRNTLDINPSSLPALLTLGNLLLSQGDKVQALPLLKRAYSLSPTPHLASTIAGLE